MVLMGAYQETFDSRAELLKHFPELNEQVIEDRPNILNCMNLIVAMDQLEN